MTGLKLPNGIPSHDTFRRVFAQLEPSEFGKCLIHWRRQRHDRSNGKPPIHMVNAWAVKNHMVLGQMKTDAKSNEITIIHELLKVISIKDCTVTIDAMGCQKEIAKQIVARGGDYVFSLKGNQGNLHKEVELLFENAKQDHHKDVSHDTHKTVDGEHGRIETRYYISSLPNGAKRFGEAARGHWGVEISLHWRLDIAFREDDCRLRVGHGAQNMAVIRRFALSLVKQDPLRKIGVKASRKRAGWDDDYLLSLFKL